MKTYVTLFHVQTSTASHEKFLSMQLTVDLSSNLPLGLRSRYDVQTNDKK